MAKKLTLDEMIEQVDAAKKTNPLDLSSDQDLSIALMNLISLEEHFFFSGAKTGKPGFYDLINTVRGMRGELMARIVEKNTVEHGEIWCISKHLLAASMRLKEVGDKANAQGKKKDAQKLYDQAYDLYSLFWGINMDLIDLSDVKMIENKMEITVSEKKKGRAVAAAVNHANKTAPANDSESLKPSRSGLLSSLGSWVKKSVNCCIE